MKNRWHEIKEDLRAQNAFGVVVWIVEELYELEALLRHYAEFEERHGI